MLDMLDLNPPELRVYLELHVGQADRYLSSFDPINRSHRTGRTRPGRASGPTRHDSRCCAVLPEGIRPEEQTAGKAGRLAAVKSNKSSAEVRPFA
jgi:hypothetical protein